MRVALRALVMGAFVVAVAGCWPVPGHDPDRTGYDDLETAITPATVARLGQRWTWSGSPNLYMPVRSPVVSTGGVHVVSGCALVTISSATGAERWRVELPNTEEAQGWPCDGSIRQAHAPFVIGNSVYAGMVFRFDGRPPPTPVTPIYDAATGSWDVSTGEPTSGGLDVDAALAARRGDAVASLDGIGGFHGTFPFLTPFLDLFPRVGTSGTEQRALPPSSDGRMTLGTEALYTVGDGTSLAAFPIADPDPSCGGGSTECPLWTATLDAPPAGRPVIGQGGATVYIGTSAGTLYALDAATGAVSWTAPVGSAVTDSPALAHDTLYVPTAAGDLVALAAGGCGAAACSPTWTASASAGSRLGGQPVAAGDVVLTGSDNGALRAFDAGGCGAATCAALWSASTGSQVTGMAVTAGTLYVGTADTRLIAYRLG